jgi:hypothetical protein
MVSAVKWKAPKMKLKQQMFSLLTNQAIEQLEKHF